MANVDNSPWDASKAWANGAASDNPAAFYNGICAGKKKGDPKTQGAHALPHHYHPGDSPNAAGVRNALSRLPQTNDLTNKAAAESHLNGHMKIIQAATKAGKPPDIRALRALHAGELPAGAARIASFPGELRANLIVKDGKQFYEVNGYATVFNRAYQMWDAFGPYNETADAHMLDKSLSKHPDVAFLTNHTGMTMARTKNGTLELNKDDLGLKVHAFLNADRTDIQNLARAINDELIDEMSFAFMLEEGEWNDDFSEFRIIQADIDRGDVSAVNYGANPYTSIGARAAEFMRLAERVPPAMAREAIALMAKRDDVHITVNEADEEDDTDPIEGIEGESVEGYISDDVANDATYNNDGSVTGTSSESATTGRAYGTSTSGLSVHLSDSDEEGDDSSVDQRSADSSNPNVGMAANLVRNRLAAMTDGWDEE
jgi:hypothetical protein